ncbi:YcaO-like family protein [Streptomyces incarnatus]
MPDYPVSALPVTVPFPEGTLAQIVWDWTPGTGLLSGDKVLLPVDLVRRRAHRPERTPDLLRATSTGLACGNTRDEALLHALFEVVERDVMYRDQRCGGRLRTSIDPTTVDDPHARDVIDRLTAAGMGLEAALVEGPYNLPVYVAYLWSEDAPVIFAGGGCHIRPAIALTRALAEAVQSRLATIVGTRDDLPSDLAWLHAPSLPAPPPRHLSAWSEAITYFTPEAGGFAVQVVDVARRIQVVTGHEPIALDLSTPGSPVHAVQVVCPGTRSGRALRFPLRQGELCDG